ncbi:Uncharacterised protein [uncultured archaeon]|nr:Uncharacterised protein [uncultured archaeon]
MERATDIKHGLKTSVIRAGVAERTISDRKRRREFIRGRLETCCPFQGRLGSKWRAAPDLPGKSQPRRYLYGRFIS